MFHRCLVGLSMDFSVRNLKIMWTDKDLKEKGNKRKRKTGKWLEKRENHLNKERERGKYKGGGAFTKKLLLSPLFRYSLCLPCLVFSFHYAELISLFVGRLM